MTTAGPEWKQFRFSVGAPDAEAKFRKAIDGARRISSRIDQYPSLYVGRTLPRDSSIADLYDVGFPWISSQELAFGMST